MCGGQWSEDNFCELVFFFYHKSLGIWLRLGNGDFIRWAMSHHKPLLVLKDSSDFEAPTWFIFMCVSEQVCTYVCVCIEARSLTLGVFLFCCLPCIWDSGGGAHWFLCTGWPASSRDLLVSTLQALRLQAYTTKPTFLSGCWESSSGPNAYMTHILPLASSSHVCNSFSYCRIASYQVVFINKYSLVFHVNCGGI